MKPFQNVANARPGRSVFDLSYQKLGSCNMGELIPVMCDEVIPGDKWKLGNQLLIRFNPLVAPVMHEINAFVHYFFVPYRLLDENWEEFITGGVNGDDTSSLPYWDTFPGGTAPAVGSLWDYFGFPVGVKPATRYPLDYPRRAYNLVWNEYYRDETLQTELDITDFANQGILNRCWEKDYFTSALPWQQRGTSPSLPITGTSSAVWDDNDIVSNIANAQYIRASGDAIPHAAPYIDAFNNSFARDNFRYFINHNIVDLSDADSFDIADLRVAFQIQRWLERNARCGVRYTEFLKAHYNVSPRDDRLQRPEYIGGSRTPVIVSEVLQTSKSETGAPQGNMAGHGISVSGSYCGNYFAQEFGLIIGLMSVMPKTMYQQGINRQWLRQSKYDFPFPEFANLSEQAIERVEIFASDTAGENTTLFGFQGRYDECRYKPNQVVGLMRTDFDHWHLARQFSSAPTLNADFVKCVPDTRIFAVENQPGIMFHIGNMITAIRPLPVSPEPGLIDHN